MSDPVLIAVITAVISGAVTFASTVVAVRVELKWLRADIDRLMKHAFP